MNKNVLFETLRTRILTLEAAPGSALDEARLAAEFGVSRTPLRDVLQRLAGAGYVVLEANRGASVSSMDLATMRHFFQCAPMIYAAVARLAAEHGNSRQLAELKHVQQRFRTAVDSNDVARMVMLNHHFHELIGTMAASPYLTPSLARLLIDHSRMSQTFYRARTREERSRIQQAAEQHEALIDAIGRQEAAEAVRITLEHWALSRDRIEQYVRPDPLPLDPAAATAREARDAI